MKDSEFIELLNLYLDHEISPTDSARLEAEVQSNPERRKIYQQYCRMQKACKVLAADFVTADEAAAAPANKKIVAFNVAAADAAAKRRKRAGNLYTLGTFAAAACVAIIVVTRNQQSAAEQAALVAHEPAPVVQTSAPARSVEAKAVLTSSNAVAVSDPRAWGDRQGSVAPSHALVVHHTLMADPLFLAGKAQADALKAAAMEQTKQFAWLETKLPPVQLPAAPATDLRFENAAATLHTEGRALGNRASANATTDMAAFQFVK